MMRLFLLSCLVCGGLGGCSQHTQSAHAIATPSTPSAIQRQIKNATDAGDGDYEMRLFRERLIAEPGSLPARLDLVQAYAKRGYPELALDHCRLAGDRFPDSAQVALLLGKTLRQLNRNLDAAKSLQTFLAAYPQPGPDLYSWLGIFLDEAGDWTSGEAAHRKALTKLDRDYLRNNLGYALLRQGKRVEAETEFRAALKLNPRSETARDNLGAALLDSPAEAILHWQSLNEPATAHSNLAALLMEQGRYKEARRELETALQYNRANPAALANLKLLSNLDEKPVTIPNLFASQSRWDRTKGALRTLWHGAPGAGQQPVQVVTKSSEPKL